MQTAVVGFVESPSYYILQYGMHTEQRQFGPHNSAEIVAFLQATIPQYEKQSAAKSFLYRALKRHSEGALQPHLEPHRDKHSENKGKKKGRTNKL